MFNAVCNLKHTRTQNHIYIYSSSLEVVSDVILNLIVNVRCRGVFKLLTRLLADEFRAVWFVGSFAKLRKSNLSFVMSASLSIRQSIVRMVQLGFNCTDFYKIGHENSILPQVWQNYRALHVSVSTFDIFGSYICSSTIHMKIYWCISIAELLMCISPFARADFHAQYFEW